ncbi:MAG: serine/threonine protein kinase, partial [Planctomycetes bacterium]|nr:serine/threonine protein kinase [Planctomycetota bacterium]
MAYRFKHGDRPLEDYTIQRAVGAGGFGEVYYAISDGGREVALKYLKENPEIELRGVGHTINLKSPHLVTIFDVKKSVDGDYFIIMEYCSGPSLRDLLIAESNGFKPEKAAFFVREIAKGLSHLHDRGIVHRDLKPGNIFYDDGYVKIGDYGLSKFISVSRHSAQTASIGTVHYMAPEIGSGNYSHSVDIYALGVMLYEMLLGRVPFEGASMGEVLMKHLTSQPEVDNLPQPFAAVIRKALIKDPKDRYQSVDEMVSDMLAGEELQNSVAGFRPASLTVAVNHGGPAIGHSPMPSPNPIPGHVRDFVKRAVAPQAMPPTPPPFAVPLNERLARKMEKLSNKVERKMAKLAGKRGGGFKNASQLAAEAASEAAHRAAAAASSPPQALAPSGSGTPTKRSKASLVRRIFVGCLLTAGVSIGYGFIVSEAYGGDWGIREEAGTAAGLLIPALAIGIAGSRSILRRWRMEDDPYWTKGLVRILVAAGPLAIALMPMFAGRSGEVGAAIFIGLLATAVLGAPSWEKVVEGGSRGELNIWGAAWSGLVAMFFTAIGGAIMDCDPEEFVLIAGGAATAA